MSRSFGVQRALGALILGSGPVWAAPPSVSAEASDPNAVSAVSEASSAVDGAPSAGAVSASSDGDGAQGVADAFDGVEAPPPVEVTDPAAEATQLFWLANDLYLAGRCAEAQTLYERVHELSGEAAALFNSAQCFRAVKDCDAARSAYRRYVEVEPNPPPEAHQWEASFARECPGGGLAGADAIDVSLPAEASTPSHEPPRGQEPREPIARPWRSEDTVALTLLASGAVSLGVAGWFGYKADDANTRLTRRADNLVGSDETWGAEETQLEKEEARYDALTVGLGIAGLALVGTGASLFWFEPFAEDGTESVDQVGFAVSLQPNGLSCWGLF